MNGQKGQDLAACAHLHVERFTVENHGKVFEEQWRCRECGAKFVSLDGLFAGPQHIQIMEPMRTLRDEFAMAALNGYIACDATGETYWRTKESRVQVADESYAWADAMLEARKK
jgi:hypothetical protein